MKLLELICGRHFKGTYFSLFLSRITVIVFVIVILVIGFLRFSEVSFYSRVRFTALFIRSTLFALQHLSGINDVFYFSSTVFKGDGVPSDLPNICIGIANLSGVDTFWLPSYKSKITVLFCF